MIEISHKNIIVANHTIDELHRFTNVQKLKAQYPNFDVTSAFTN